jgi:hypothetical protein
MRLLTFFAKNYANFGILCSCSGRNLSALLWVFNRLQLVKLTRRMWHSSSQGMVNIAKRNLLPKVHLRHGAYHSLQSPT